ncbi:NGG1p interacting factor 3 [Hygrophoropsis aurantiaca]|uniref:NGG1p interacting factor 3 n=1 Tax=Hygrophoropsis aurantiaca TaxID=72124 RepID=A0ACB8ANQ1_9AGAM|nr:NGG1p interacting factor 3 [Hygrophoropsis aurantiaca]
MQSIVTKVVCKAFERIAPLRLAEKWDKVSRLLESPFQRANANRVLLTIDLTPDVLAEALRTPTAFIVSYHPSIFSPLPSLTLSTPLQASLLSLAVNGISLYCPHTSLDSVHGGINDWLARGVKGESDNGDVSIIGDVKGDNEGGAGRIVTLDRSIDIGELVKRIKNHLQLEQVDVGHPMTPKPIRTVAICAGAGESMLSDIDADVYFTGEMPHHAVLAAVAKGVYVVLCGHTNTERGYLPVLAEKLRATFSQLTEETVVTESERTELKNLQLEVFVSKEDRHPLQRM